MNTNLTNTTNKNIHFIAIGGSVMHNLAINLKEQGYNITGSDDEITEPSSSRLKVNGILPENYGWFPEKIHSGLDAIILGMHAKANNPELIKAQELRIKIYSYPEFIYEKSRTKHRIVIAGSHGKTTITSMILHVLKYLNKDFDYLVGAQIKGFENMVRLSEKAPVIIMEGDEYPASVLDKRPKFHVYHHHIGVLSGIAWDHINIFKTFDDYKLQFEIFADKTPIAGSLVYCKDDKIVSSICSKERYCVKNYPYGVHPYFEKQNVCYLITNTGNLPLKIFGEHNLRNLNAAKQVCNLLCIKDEEFYQAISSFEGASRRLQLIKENNFSAVFLDFAHAPSKLKASTYAVKKRYGNRKLVACLELHTYSSLNKDFLNEYKNSFEYVDVPIIYFNPHTLQIKGLAPVSSDEIIKAFNHSGLKVFNDATLLQQFLSSMEWKNTSLLMMSSGTFDGLDVEKLANMVTKNS